MTSSASSASRSSTSRSVVAGSPQANSSSSTNPIASPVWNRPRVSSRAAWATAPVCSRSSASRIVAALSCAVRPGSRLTAAISPACSDRDATTSTVRSDSSAARSAAISTLELFGSTMICSAATPWIAASRSEVEGLSFGPTSSVPTPSDAYSSLKPSPVTTASAPQVASAGGALPRRPGARWWRLLDLDRPRRRRRPVGGRHASATCSVMSAMSMWETRADAGEQRGRGVRVIGVDVDLQRRRVADDEHRIADPLELADEMPLVQLGAGDGEVRAVPEGAG